MICPDCGHDNIDGVDTCETCQQPLVQFDVPKTELERLICDETIDSLVPKVPISVEPTSTVASAISTMLQCKIGCLLVVNENQVVGVFTERDVLTKVSGDLSLKDRSVSELMTPTPETVSGSDSIAYALHAMDLGGYRHMPVIDDDQRPNGIVSVRDILRKIRSHFDESA